MILNHNLITFINSMRKRISLILLIFAICTFTSDAVISSNCAYSNGGVCQQCDQGYRIDRINYFCYTCNVPNCRTCPSSREICLYCLDGYIFNSTSNACVQDPVIENCLDSAYRIDTQTGVAICTSCAIGYFKFNSGGAWIISSMSTASCKKCSDNCGSCTSELVCGSCDLGFFKKTVSGKDVCTPCIQNCVQCSSAYVCTTCAQGYLADFSGQCVACQDNCAQCSDLQTCTKCADGYYLNNGNCDQCHIANCKDCTADITDCVSCLNDLYLHSTPECIVCENNCEECTSITVCTTCSDQFYLSGGDCIPCDVQNCQTCPNGPGTCTGCLNDLYLYSDSECIACEDNCDSCSSTTVCTLCHSGYLVDTQDCIICLSIIANCETCSDVNTCDTCKLGYYWVDGTPDTCQPCSGMLHCTQCSDSSTCTACEADWVVKNAGDGCIQCVAGCLQCSDEYTCQKCVAPKYIQRIDVDTADRCSQCSVINNKCTACTMDGVCTAVEAGYFINATSLNDYACDDVSHGGVTQCAECRINGGRCTKCNDGFYLIWYNYLCQECRNDVLYCSKCDVNSIYDDPVCTQCDDGYFVEGGKCTPCSTSLSASCSVCESAIKCTECDDPTYLDTTQNICKVCPTGCTSCDLANENVECDACDSLYFLDGTDCVPCAGCSVGCSSSAETCTGGSCLDKYIAGTALNTCVPDTTCTKINCLNCGGANKENYCIECQVGFFPLDGECYPCMKDCLQCPNDAVAIHNGDDSGSWDTELTDLIDALPPSQVFTLLDAVDIAGATTPQDKNYYYIAYMGYKYLISLGFDATMIAVRLTTDDTANTNILKASDTTLLQKAVALFPKISNYLDFTADEIKANVLEYIYNQIDCTACPAGLYLNNGDPVRCLSCDIFDCVECASDGITCTTCEDGFYKDNNNRLCKKCDPLCKTCSSTSTTCGSCFTGYVFDTNTCIKCNSPCSTCEKSDLSFCDKCIKPYSTLADAEGNCYLCEEPECVRCSASDYSLCFQCEATYTLVHGVCQTCPANCATCYTGICTVCNRRFVLVSGACVACPNKCVSCVSESLCTACAAGYYVNSFGLCSACAQGCAQCSSLDVCNAYQNGITVFNGEIVECRPGCQSCDPLNPSKCLKCKAKHFKDNFECRPCFKNCQQCSSATYCFECVARAYLIGGGNGQCQICQGDCKTCIAADTTKCLTCRRGYILVGNVCRNICKKGCSICTTDPQKCDQCAEGYALTAQRTCVKCIGTCSGTCNPKNITQCIGCANGFYLSSNRCLRCERGCASCSDGQTCDICFPEYELNDGSCSERCKFPCKQCRGTNCSKCIAGFKLSNNVCVPDLTCNPNCDFCPPGTYQEDNGNCAICENNCAACDVYSCLKCFQGFYLDDNGVCTACDASCKICDGPGYCQVCADGYMIKVLQMESLAEAEFGETCQVCSSECATCFLQPDYCLSCKDDKKLNGITCINRRVVKFEYLFKEDFDQFMENTGIDGVVQELCAAVGIDQNRLVLNSVTSGSIKVTGDLSAEAEEEAQYMKVAAVSVSFRGLTIESSSFGVYYDDSEVPDQTDLIDDSKDSSNSIEPAAEQLNTVALTVGVFLGGFILIALFAFITYKVKLSFSGSQKIESKDTPSFEVFKRKQYR